MARYVSVPQEIEAVQWIGDNVSALTEFAGTKFEVEPDGSATLLSGKDGAQGRVPLPVGHWAVNMPDDKSDIWPVDNDYFTSKYAKVGD